MARPHICDVPGCTRTRRRWQRLCENCFGRLPGDIRTGIIDSFRAGRRADHREHCRRAAEHLGRSDHAPNPVTPEQAFANTQRLLGEN